MVSSGGKVAVVHPESSLSGVESTWGRQCITIKITVLSVADNTQYPWDSELPLLKDIECKLLHVHVAGTTHSDPVLLDVLVSRSSSRFHGNKSRPQLNSRLP